MELQKFVTEVIEAIGGIVEPLEYALVSVLIPEEYRHIFQGKTELLLAFDYEVAQENPEAEFITLGSFLLEQIIEFANNMAVSTVRYVIVDQLTLSGELEKIKRFIGITREQVDILSSRKVFGAWVEFNYKVGYTSDERVEEDREIWINLQTGKSDLRIMENRSNVFYSGSKKANYPVSSHKDVLEAFEISYNYIKEEAEKNKSKFTDEIEMNREIQRIVRYYDELFKENSKKMSRKGISQERIRELTSKSEALKIEKEKQISEMMHKYSVKVDISLQYSILYYIPVIEYNVRVTSKSSTNDIVLYYNPIIKDFQM